MLLRILTAFKPSQQKMITSTAEENILVTLSCPHFAVFPLAVYRAFSKALSQEHVPTWKRLLSTHSETEWSLESLWRNRPTVLISMHMGCGRPGCCDDPQNWGPELERLLLGIRDFLNTRKELYFELGAQYFNMLQFLPASAIKNETAALVHQQYLTETRPWDQDPFFDSWRQAVSVLESAMTTHQPTSAPTQDVLRYIVRGMPALNRLANTIWELRQQAADHSRRPRNPRPYPRRTPRRRQFRIERDIDSPKVIFANNAHKAWKKRMYGFESFGVSAPMKTPLPMAMEVDPEEADEYDEMATVSCSLM